MLLPAPPPATDDEDDDDDDNDDDDVDDEDGETKWATKFKVGRGCKECISSTAFS